MSTQSAILALLQASAKALDAAMLLMQEMQPSSPITQVWESASDGWPEDELDFEETAEPFIPIEEAFVPIETVAEPAAEPVAEPVAEVSVPFMGTVSGFNESEHKAKKDKRLFSKLNEALPFGTSVSVTSLGDVWTAVFTPEGFKMGDLPPFKSPMAFSRAHANRITDAHPKETKPGNGWDHIKVGTGEHLGKTIGQLYNEHFAH